MSDNQPTMPVPEVSPLLEADPGALNEFIETRVNEIFNKKPIMLTDEDLKIAVDYYRSQRARFKAESEKKAIAGPTSRRTKAATPIKSVAEALAIPVEDLL